jgi:NADH-quinone oxidoreductase subunit C
MTWPLDEPALRALGERVASRLGVEADSASVAHGELTVTAPRERIVEVLTALRDSEGLRFHQLLDVCGVDYPQRAQRFDVVYHLLSMTQNQRIRVKIATDEDTPVDSVAEVFPSAIWYEREAFDMFGIFFSGHPDLRRLLTDYGFQGYPLRKDFPMTGRVEVRYDDSLKRVIYEPVKSVEFRSWDFLSPWEGARQMTKDAPAALPGDQKAGGAA